MAEAVEVFDDLSAALLVPTLPIPPSPPGIVRVVKTTKVYAAGTVRVFINGFLQTLDGVFEIDPGERLVGLGEDPLEDAGHDASVHVAYLTFEPVFIDPGAPVHIAQLREGDVLRIAMRAGRHLEPVVSPRGRQPRLIARERSRAARNSSRTVFMGFVTGNAPTTGTLSLQVPHRANASREHYAATVNYVDILTVQKFITPTREPRPVPVGGGPRAVRHPGVIAKGVLDSPGFPRLIQVRF